ncbi:MAG: CRISPR-associated endonuclease Cas1 [Candidatus Eisenbacteria bacterium]|nr:CRISPR-associated endonuclease Cas1 [Candidatus Eisenbacteria bacterium]
MLNIAMTALHRQLVLAIRLAGLVPTIGFLHAPRSGHATLASDLQEPFRHLMDRAVIHAAKLLKPTDFRRDTAAEHPVTISPQALRKILGAVHGTFAHASHAAGRTDTCAYRTHMLLAARSLRRHIEDRAVRFEVFRHPETGPTEEHAP